MRKRKMTEEQASKMFPIGTAVKYFPITGGSEYEETVVQSEAWALGHGELVIQIAGQRGGVSLSNLELL